MMEQVYGGDEVGWVDSLFNFLVCDIEGFVSIVYCNCLVSYFIESGCN